MVGVWRRVCALVMVLALVAMAPGGVTGGCTTCTAECPMHQHRPHALGCHHGTHASAVPDGQTCLGPAGCGHHEALTPIALQAVVEPVVAVAPLVDGSRISSPSAGLVSRDATAPPHGPPEPLFV